MSRSSRRIERDREEQSVVESSLDARGRKLLVWSWYWMAGARFTSPYRAKFIELTRELAGASPLACGFTAYTDNTDGDDASELLTAFMDSALTDIEASVASARQD